MFQFPKFVFDCLILSVCSAAGQLFIYYTIATFGPVVFVIIMTIRQVKNLMYYYRNACLTKVKSRAVPVPNHLVIIIWAVFLVHVKISKRDGDARWAIIIAEKEGLEQRNSNAALKLSSVIYHALPCVIWIQEEAAGTRMTAHKAVYVGCGGRDPYILNLNIRWRWMVNFMLWLLYP
jgi:hypothetical protein